MKAFVVLISFLFLMPYAHSQQSMRRCMLLPITDSIEGVLGFKVFEELEYYLRNSTWCYYRTNSDIIDILGNYKNNLSEHLNNPEVLRILAEKTKAGSMIRTKLLNDVNGVRINMDVVADNGADILFSEQTRLPTDDITQISQTLKNWLQDYEKRIPYDARVVAVLGDQFTADFGREYGVVENRAVKIIRPVAKKQHPLLKEVVEWETEPIADGTLFHVVELQSQGRIVAYQSQKKLMLNDWIVLEETGGEEITTFEKTVKDDDYKFGRIGNLALMFAIGGGSLTQLQTNQNISKMGGTLIGGEAHLDIWITRNFWIGGELSKKFSTYKQDSGNFTNPENSTSTGIYKVKLGYKYLPLGFFYGPQLDGYLGFGRYTYGFDTSRADGITDTAFSGILFGTKGVIPFLSKYKAFMKLDFLFNPSFSEEVQLQGDADSSSNFNIGFGVQYDYTPSLSFISAFDYAQSRAKFVNPVRDLKYKDSSLKLGAVFSF